MKRYYSTQRPVGPGTYPKPRGISVIRIVNFDRREKCAEIGWRPAWGYIDYEKPIPRPMADAFELVPAP